MVGFNKILTKKDNFDPFFPPDRYWGISILLDPTGNRYRSTDRFPSSPLHTQLHMRIKAAD